jgi:SAM-dependent methyltransferase
MTDARRYAPATQRNRGPILELLRGVLPARGLVLEIASGTGEHVVHFARELPGLTFQPSDPEPSARDSIAAWTTTENLTNIRPPMEIDAATTPWPVEAADAIVCVNMIHISPWASTLGLMRGAAAILPAGAPLFLYGPYFRADVPTAPSNLEFDADLKRRNPAWGLRDLAAVAEVARAAGFSAPVVTEMPANNLGVVYRRL